MTVEYVGKEMTKYDPMDDILAELDALEDVNPKEAAYLIAEQKFQENVRADIDWLLKSKGISRKDLAEELGVTPPAVSKMLGKPNLTLKTIARIFKAIGEECELSSPTLGRMRANANFKHWFLLVSQDVVKKEDKSRVQRGIKTPSCKAFHIDVREMQHERSEWRAKTRNDNVGFTELAEAIVNV